LRGAVQDFIDYFSYQYPREWAKPQFKLLMSNLIEEQINRIDVAIGNLTQRLYDLIRNETSFSTFLNTLSQGSITSFLFVV
jgi:hypothetical protein